MRLIDADALDYGFPMTDDVYGLSRQIGIEMVKARINEAPTIEAEPVVHAKWVDRYGGKYANHLYECSACKGKALYNIEADVLGKENLVQALSAACPHCRAKMDLSEKAGKRRLFSLCDGVKGNLQNSLEIFAIFRKIWFDIYEKPCCLKAKPFNFYISEHWLT